MPATVAEISKQLANVDEEELAVLESCLSSDPRKGVQAALKRAKKRIASQKKEEARLKGIYEFQKNLAHSALLMGLDEVGRGPVAGPLTVGAVVLPESPRIPQLNDSKQIPENRREELSKIIKENALAWSIQHIQPEEIDAAGMTACLRMAFLRAIQDIDSQIEGVECVLLDGNALHIDSREINVIKGDARCASIAAASIIAKVERDNIMIEYAKHYPEYHFDSCKGYASAEHIKAIKEQGLSPIHRVSFCSAWTQEKLF